MREHPLFQVPEPIDVKATIKKPVPASWRASLPGVEQIDVLPVGDEPGGRPGWCTAGPEISGPELEWICGGINSKQPTHASIWRQGNLLHFGFEPPPSKLNATGQSLLRNSIAYISRFVTDRPIVRQNSFVDPTGPAAPGWRLQQALIYTKTTKDLAEYFVEPWNQKLLELGDGAREYLTTWRSAVRVEGKRLALDADALALDVDLQQEGVLTRLAGMLNDDARKDAARALLLRILVDGPDASTTPNNWRNWLQLRADWMAFDPHCNVWRIDQLAHARSEKSSSLRGPARADGDVQRDARATALAAKVQAHHGARGLNDLHSFTCREGDVRYLWDRSAGIFRVENRHVIPAGNRATPWQVAILDVTGDRDLILGGGPEPRSTVSCRGMFQDLVGRTFSPLLLLEPGTSLKLLPGDGPVQQLEVRLAGRCFDQRRRTVLHVDAATGAVQQIDEHPGTAGRPQTWRVDGCTQTGTLLLPSKFTLLGPRPREEQFNDLTWNPAVPPGAATAKEPILGGG